VSDRGWVTSMILSVPGKTWHTMSSFGTSVSTDAAKDY
jgi:hypothetical protein